MVHEVLLVRRLEGVEHLVHLRHAERCHVEHLGLATLEQASAVSAGDDSNFGSDRTQVLRLAAVDPFALGDDALTDDLLLQRT